MGSITNVVKLRCPLEHEGHPVQHFRGRTPLVLMMFGILTPMNDCHIIIREPWVYDRHVMYGNRSIYHLEEESP